jgi:hypothetical protein
MCVVYRQKTHCEKGEGVLMVWMQLAKASTLALISMMIILIAVVTQGFTVPADSRGNFGWRLLTINDGIFQAIGVISFGKPSFKLLMGICLTRSDQLSSATTIPSSSTDP